MSKVLNVIITIVVLVGTALAATGHTTRDSDHRVQPADASAGRVPPTKLGSRVSYLASVRGTARALPGTRQAKVIDRMEEREGAVVAVVTIPFDHVLTVAEIKWEDRIP